MRNAIFYSLTLCLSLWLGGLVALVIFVSSLFAFQRSMGVAAAPELFHVFERYQIGLAAVTLVLIGMWIAQRRSPLKWTAAFAAAFATVLAVVQIAWITPTINASRAHDVATFDRFHHLATTNYSSMTLLIALTEVLCLMAATREAAIRRAAHGTALAVASA